MISNFAKALSFIPLVAGLALAQPALGTHPAIPTNLQVETFATGLNFPYGIYGLPDGSMLAATSTGGLYGSSSQIVRYAQTNGVAGAPTVVYSGSVAGPATGLAGVGDIVAFATGIHTGSQIVIFQAGAGGALTQIGQMTFTYPLTSWYHDSHAIALRAVPGQPGSYELAFNTGSEFNQAPDVNTISVAGLTNATINGSSIYTLPFTVSGATLTAGAPKHVANGLRNAFGLGFANNGDLYFGENGIDLNGTNVPVSADYFGVVPGGTAGVLNFGFPFTYSDPLTGQQTGPGAGVTEPYTAFTPVNGRAYQGIGGMAITPQGFLGLDAGAFFGFFGNRFDGIANTLGGVLFVDTVTGETIDFLPNTQTGVNHPVSLFATGDALYIADLGSIDRGPPGTIYRVTAITTVPEPQSILLIGAGLCVIAIVGRRRQRGQSHA